MTKEELLELDNLLDKLIKECTPCKCGPCKGYLNCGFGEDGCYGESCAIKDVSDVIGYILRSLK